MPAPTGRRRPSGSPARGDRTGGSVREGVEAWLGAYGAPSPDGAPTDQPTHPPEDTAAAGPEADTEAVARKILLDALTGQARSRAELAARLARKQVPAEVAERLLDRFEEVGLVDDEAFARMWVQSRQSGKGLARRALGQELRRKGVDDDTVTTVLDEVDPDDEVEAARRLVRRKLRSVQALEPDKAVRRLAGMLARKGYGPGVAFRVVKEELAAPGDDLPGLHDLP